MPTPSNNPRQRSLFFSYTKLGTAAERIPVQIRASLRNPDLSDQEDQIRTICGDYYNQICNHMQQNGFLQYSEFLSSLLLACVIFYYLVHKIHPSRYRNLRDINCHFEEGSHGYFHMVESKETYLATFCKFVIFILRISAANGKEPFNFPTTESISTHLQSFLENCCLSSLHQLLVQLFKPHIQSETVRGEHPVGWTVHWFCKKSDGSFENLGNINHLLVHLIYMIRLVTYWELILHPGGDRFEILKSVKSK